MVAERFRAKSSQELGSIPSNRKQQFKGISYNDHNYYYERCLGYTHACPLQKTPLGGYFPNAWVLINTVGGFLGRYNQTMFFRMIHSSYRGRITVHLVSSLTGFDLYVLKLLNRNQSNWGPAVQRDSSYGEYLGIVTWSKHHMW